MVRQGSAAAGSFIGVPKEKKKRRESVTLDPQSADPWLENPSTWRELGDLAVASHLYLIGAMLFERGIELCSTGTTHILGGFVHLRLVLRHALALRKCGKGDKAVELANSAIQEYSDVGEHERTVLTAMEKMLAQWDDEKSMETLYEEEMGATFVDILDQYVVPAVKGNRDPEVVIVQPKRRRASTLMEKKMQKWSQWSE